MVFFTLKAVRPIDCHYMTDRLQRFELKILVCVLLKKQSHLHLFVPQASMSSFCLFTDQNVYLILKEKLYNLLMNVLKCHSRLTMEEKISVI